MTFLLQVLLSGLGDGGIGSSTRQLTGHTLTADVPAFRDSFIDHIQ